MVLHSGGRSRGDGNGLDIAAISLPLFFFLSSKEKSSQPEQDHWNYTDTVLTCTNHPSIYVHVTPTRTRNDADTGNTHTTFLHAQTTLSYAHMTPRHVA